MVAVAPPCAAPARALRFVSSLTSSQLASVLRPLAKSTDACGVRKQREGGKDASTGTPGRSVYYCGGKS